jgi:hypothetical protein
VRDIFRRSITIGTVLLLLAGCATAAQRQMQNIHQTVLAAVTELKTCQAAVRELPEAEALREHLPRDLRDATLDQMMDKSKVTAEQIAAIKLIHPKIAECRRTFLDHIEPVLPSIAAIYADEMQQGDARLIELLQRKITWGTYITNGKETGVAFKPKIDAEWQKIAGGLERSHEAELAQRQAAANSLMQYYQTQEMIDAMNRPQINTATCTSMGNTVNCMGVTQ